ncbi:MAG: 16S rRNA (uracil(1498)-N(3))-methyltransferase [Clostridia bacterium]|nr:16S rRNA (uracil(1498)-N(3))-methyltransferase [Clostridia bacterium]
MPKFFVKENQIENNKINIVGTDVNHIKNVLRLGQNEQIEICSFETQKNYLCEIENLSEEKILCSIIKELEKNSEPNVKVTIFQGLPKSEKMELVIQKSVELGVYDITPVEMQRCVVKLNEKDKIKKIDRWQKIAEVASKQCGRDIIPKINNIINIKNICNIIGEYDILLLAYEKEDNNLIKNELQEIKKKGLTKIGVIIGPEGGIDEKEAELLQQAGVKIISLGKRILRTETVALNVLSNIMYELEM